MKNEGLKPQTQQAVKKASTAKESPASVSAIQKQIRTALRAGVCRSNGAGNRFFC